MTPTIALEVDRRGRIDPLHDDGAVIAIGNWVDVIHACTDYFYLAADFTSKFIDRHCMQSPCLAMPLP